MPQPSVRPGRERYGRLMEVFPFELRRELWTDSRQAQAVRLEPASRGLAGLQLLDLETYLPGDLLLKVDLASMAHSLELRSPFLDHEVVALGLGLPDTLKTRGREGKVALRRAFAADLPPEVEGRGKMGFGVPLGRWFREDMGPPQPGRARWFRVRVTDQRTGRVRSNVSVPIGMVGFGLGFARRFRRMPGVEHVDDLFEAVRTGRRGVIFDISNEDAERVEIFID